MKKDVLTIFFVILVFSMSLPQIFADSDDNNNPVKENYREGTIGWVDRCIMEGHTATIRVSDVDMNLDHSSIQSFDIEVWSDSDRLEKNLTVTETGINTGIFESVVFFKTLDDGSGNRIRAFNGDVVYARYIDGTIPNSNSEKEKIATFIMSDLRVIDWLNHEPVKLLYDPCTLQYLKKNADRAEQIKIVYPAPLKQIKSGLLLDEIKCKEGLGLSYRYDDVTVVSSNAVVTTVPVCIKDETRQNLFERGWLQTSPTIPNVGKNGTLVTQVNDEFFTIHYNVKNANVSKVVLDENNSQSLLVYVQILYPDPKLEITLPREMINAKLGPCTQNPDYFSPDDDDMFFVLSDNIETEFTEIKTTKYERTLSIPLNQDSSEIKIIGTCLL